VEFSRELPATPAPAVGPEVLRIDEHTLAIRQPEGWLLVSASAPLQVTRLSQAELQGTLELIHQRRLAGLVA
jgi:hypothetical protein